MLSHVPLPLEGGCQCGQLRYRCTAAPFVAYTCHCRACQKLSSSAFISAMHVPAEALALAGEPAVRERVADSGNRLATSFCPGCGSALMSRNSARPRVRTIYVGTLDTPEVIPVSAHIWTTGRLPWVVLPEGHRVFPAAGDWRPDYAADPTRLTGDS
jgi:hypothetical protein